MKKSFAAVDRMIAAYCGTFGGALLPPSFDFEAYVREWLYAEGGVPSEDRDPAVDALDRDPPEDWLACSRWPEAAKAGE